jgi:hypothetical protein
MPDQACWFCQDLGGVAIHIQASAEHGRTVWVGHRLESRSHPVHPCPACALGEALAHLGDARTMMARMAGMLPDYF